MSDTQTTRRTANGNAATVSQFPFDCYKDAAIHLRRPFTAAAVKFKVQATWPKDTPTGGLIVAYIDARLAVERLNLIIPNLWHDEYEPTPKGLMWCSLTVDGITRRDIGEGIGKGLVSDALKRAAVKFGVGVSLYAIPKMMLNVGDGHLKPKRSREGATLELTPAGEKFVRSRYESWLRDHGVHAFGDPLDHGDSDDAQGDAEAEPDVPVLDSPPVVTDEGVAALTAAAKGLKAVQLKDAFAMAGLAKPERIDANVFRSVPREKSGMLARALSGMDRA